MKAIIPKTDSIRELAKFFETHEFSDYADQMERVKGPLFECDLSVNVRLKPSEMKIIKGIAKKKGVKDSDVVRAWIREKIKAS